MVTHSSFVSSWEETHSPPPHALSLGDNQYDLASPYDFPATDSQPSPHPWV